MPTARSATPVRKFNQVKERVAAARATVAGGEGFGSGGGLTVGKYYLTFPCDLADEAVICDMYDRFGVKFSIRQAHVSDDLATLGIELTGFEEGVRRAEDYLRSRGVRVDRVRLEPC